jgi:hypothetical protein
MALAVLPAPAQAGAQEPDYAVPRPKPKPKPAFVRLSNERTRTWSAYVDRFVYVRRRPSTRSRKLALLKDHTFHGSPEVVVLLGRQTVDGRRWYYIRYAGLGSRRGWVPASALTVKGRVNTRLVLNRRRFRLSLLRGRRVLFSSPIGIGAVGSPTPAGRFYIRERLGPFRATNTIYGALAFGTSAYSRYRTDWPGGGQVGIHGTNQPALIPGRISNGCVRLRNRNVLRLGRRLRVGTPLLIK